MRRWSALGGLLILASCATPPPPPPPPPPPRIVYAPPPTPAPPPDQCGAASLQTLIGRPKTEIPVPLTPSLRRVVCTTCPMTRDYNASRQTIVFDATSGLVTSVACG